jgi:hypothetical protein
MDGDGKWADRKPQRAPLPLKSAPRRDVTEQLLSGRATGASPKGLVAQVGGVAMPVRKHKKSTAVKHRTDSSALPELADDASQSDSVSSPWGDAVPVAAKKLIVPPPLGDLRVAPLTRDEGPITMTKLNQDYQDVMKKLKDQKKLPHERSDVTPRRGVGSHPRSGSAGSRRHSAQGSATPEPAPLSHRRFTDEGHSIAQPLSALAHLASISEGEEEKTEDPDTDTGLDGGGGVVVTARKMGRIRVVVRKRPFRDAETGDDCVEVNSPEIHIGALKQRVDLSEYTENHDYSFDNVFDENDRNSKVYEECGRTLIDTVFEGGSSSCFAYGQTGSGKTHTMLGNEQEDGMYIMAASDIFDRVQPEHHVFVSLYEIYCNSLFDLLNYRTAVVTREDASKKVNIVGLTWHEISTVHDLHDIIERGTVQRRTGSTSGNEFSSRSHAVLTMTLRDEKRPKFCGSLNIVDLAGSERAADTAGNDKQTRLEGAEINKSLLALKECIRGLDERKKHIPFRGSKLTEVLRDSFVGNSRTMMVATISPSSENVEHTLNTLRYAFRVKGLTIAQVDPSKQRNAPRPAPAVRSKSVDPTPTPQPSSNVPFLPPIRERKEKKRRSRERKRAANFLTPRAEQIEAVELELKSDIQTLRNEMERIASEKDKKVDLLMEQNNRLEKELRLMRRMFKKINFEALAQEDGELQSVFEEDL